MLPALPVVIFWLLSSSGGKGAQREILSAPFIHSNPVWGVKLGGTADIICKVPYSDYHFRLEPEIPSGRLLISGNKGQQTFSIVNVSREDGGKYTCYSYDPNTNFRSESSEPMELLIQDPDLPRPGISISSSKGVVEGDKVTIQCRAEGPVERFYLYTDDPDLLIQTVEPDGDTAEFLFINAMSHHEGRYYCNYRPLSGFLTSMSSTPVKLLLLATSYPRPTISMSPSDMVDLAADVTISCLVNVWSEKTVQLEKSGGPMLVDLQTWETNVTFVITNVSWEHGGEYSCRYSTRMSTRQSSDPVELLIKDSDLPRPSISLSPSSVAVLGSNVTIQCWAEGLNNTFYLHKAGEQKASQSVEPEGDTALFQINNVRLDRAGSYRCSYRPPKLFRSSENSSSVTLLVLDPSVPRPVISVKPRRLVTLGGQVKIQCETEDGPAHFFLSKDGDPALKWPMKNDWDVGELSFSNLSWKHQGIYSCSYAWDKKPFVFSPHSDPLELLVTESAAYTQINIIRFVAGGLVFLLLTCLIMADHHPWKERDKLPLSQPPCTSYSFRIQE